MAGTEQTDNTSATSHPLVSALNGAWLQGAAVAFAVSVLAAVVAAIFFGLRNGSSPTTVPEEVKAVDKQDKLLFLTKPAKPADAGPPDAGFTPWERLVIGMEFRNDNRVKTISASIEWIDPQIPAHFQERWRVFTNLYRLGKYSVEEGRNAFFEFLIEIEMWERRMGMNKIRELIAWRELKDNLKGLEYPPPEPKASGTK